MPVGLAGKVATIADSRLSVGGMPVAMISRRLHRIVLPVVIGRDQSIGAIERKGRIEEPARQWHTVDSEGRADGAHDHLFGLGAGDNKTAD